MFEVRFARVFMIGLLAVFAGCAIRHMPGYVADPTLPKVDGTLKVQGLNAAVKVYRDKWGVPHIMSDDEHDLFFAVGVVQAQDRLWEMVMLRAMAEGRLSELFGEIGVPGQKAMGMDLDTFMIDKRQRILGLNYLGHVGEALLKEKNPEILAQLQAYCDGVNAFIGQNRDRLPIEFKILYVEPEPFHPSDIISFSVFVGLELASNMDMELLRYALIGQYGEDVAWKLFPLHEAYGPTIVPPEMLLNRLPEPRPLPPGGRPDPRVLQLDPEAALKMASLNKAMRQATLFPWDTASNDWVVGPKLTTDGSAMLCNDPHLVHIEPSLFYMMHVKGAGFDAYGAAFPGSPYTVLAHTRKLAWGATTTRADVQDVFVETVSPEHPGKYLYKGQWRDFVVRREVIKVRPGLVQIGPTRRFKEKTIEIRQSIHGPIINDMYPGLPKGTPPMALRWTAWDFDRNLEVFEALITSADVDEFIDKIRKMDAKALTIRNVAIMYNILMKGQSIQDFIKAMDMIVVPNQNWVAADADGHIAYLPGGLVPIRKNGIGILPVPGESGEYDWTGFIPLMELPHAIDPERGYMVTANNEVVDAEWYPYVFATNYEMGWRAWRIEELIKKYQPLDVNKMRLIQNDVEVKAAELIVPQMVKAVEVKGVTDKRLLQAAQILREWDFQATIDSPAPAIYFDTMRHVYDRTLADEFEKKFYKDWVNGAGIIDVFIENAIIKGESPFFDNKKTKDKVEDVYDVLVASMGDAVKWLTKTLGKDMDKWRWGDLHKIKWYSPMGFGPLKEMSIGPFPHEGGDQTVRNAGFGGLGKNRYYAMGGPVLRHIMDMKDPDHALMVEDGSQSGQWLSPHYRDGHTLWYNSDYFTAEMRPEKIKEQAESVLTLVP